MCETNLPSEREKEIVAKMPNLMRAHYESVAQNEMIKC